MEVDEGVQGLIDNSILPQNNLKCPKDFHDHCLNEALKKL